MPLDLAIVGAGICGLAHALAAARRGLRVAVFDRDAQANGASIRNFGFMVVTGQQDGQCWQRAMRSRDVWLEVAAAANIPILQRGLLAAARRPEAQTVLEAFAATEMGRDCTMLTKTEAAGRFPMLAPVAAALLSPHELRVESRTAIPQLAAWLAEMHGVAFFREITVHAVEEHRIETSRGAFEAETIIVCPGDEFFGLFAERIARHALTHCKLQMLRLGAPVAPLPLPVMSDLSLARYAGYADLPEAKALKLRLEREQPAHLANGVHLIAVAGADGSLVVGDSHHYAPTPDPFASEAVDALMLEEFRAVLPAYAGLPVLERWIGTYASAADRLALIDAPGERIRLVLITSGTGASTSFAIAEEVIAELFG